MNVADIVVSEFVQRDAGTPVSKLAGTFEDPSVDGVVVTADGDYRGVVTRRDLLTSHHPPEEKAGSPARSVPTVAPTTDVREAARLLVGADTRLLPVLEGDDLVGVVTARALLRRVQPHLDVLEVRHVASGDLVTVTPGTTVGEALNAFRANHVTHLPVLDDGASEAAGTGGDLVGIVSVHDLVGVTTRAVDQPQGGSVGDAAAGRPVGGGGERSGERDRLLDLPVRDVMSSPVGTVPRGATLAEAVAAMFDHDAHSLVVEEGGDPVGIVTTTDVLLALTWTAEGNRGVQLVGAAYLDDLSYADVVGMVDDLDAKYGDMTVLEAKVHLHEHDERRRGTHLLLARVRLYTDRGHFIASGEGFGASAALNEARDVLERKLRDAKTHGRSKKHPDPDVWETIHGWQLG